MTDTMTAAEVSGLEAAYAEMTAAYKGGGVSLTAKLASETDKAFCVVASGSKVGNWIAKSQVSEVKRTGNYIKMLVPKWLFAKLPMRDKFYRDGDAIIM